jgi:formyl-CoA transferase/CoA:oxalate CoA-transferase
VLDGLIVLDFTRAVAGPFATMMLGDMGARVIKVEEPGSGDETRSWGPPFLDGWSTYFLSMNRNKESLAVDLKSAEGLALVRSIAAKADVVIQNFRPGVADRLGIGPPELTALNPRLIYASVSGFGQTGPERYRAGYDILLQAVSGSMQASAPADQDAVKVAFPIADILAALFTGQAILAALYRREKTGQGKVIEVSLLEGMLCAMSNLCSAALNTGQDPPRVGVAQPNIVPYQLFHAADAPLIVGAPNDRLWRRLCEALGRPDLSVDARFQTNVLRNQHRTELVAQLEDEFAKRTAADWQERFDRAEVPCGPVLSLTQALQSPQLAAREAIAEVTHPGLGSFRIPANPMRFEGFTPAYRAPRRVGEDTERLRAEFSPSVQN